MNSIHNSSRGVKRIKQKSRNPYNKQSLSPFSPKTIPLEQQWAEDYHRNLQRSGPGAIPDIDALSSVGIDTVWCHFELQPGDIAYNHQLTIRSSKYTHGNQELFIDDAGQSITGIEAKYHGNGIHFQIKPQSIKFKGGFLGFRSNRGFVSFSVAGISGKGDNYFAASLTSTRAVFEYVSERLRGIGVHKDIDQMKLSRVDIFMNVVLDEPCENYQPVLAALTAPRMVKDTYQTGISCHNKSQGWAIYDKIAKRRKDAEDTADLPPNVQRFEWRVKGGKSIASKLKVTTTAELLANFDKLPAFYTTALAKQQLRYKLADLEPSQSTRLHATQPIAAQIARVVRHCEKQGIALDAGLLRETLAQEGIAGFRELLFATGGLGRKYVSKVATDLQKASFHEAALSDENFQRRYEELYVKLLTPNTGQFPC